MSTERMDVVRGRVWDRPTPLGEGDFGPWYEACAQGRLLIQRCPACGHAQWYPRPVCTACAATPQWAEVAPSGTLHTFTVVRQFLAAPFKAELPYVVGLVDLDDAPSVRLFGTVTDVDVTEVRIGMSLRAYAVEYEEGRALPYWRPSPEGSSGAEPRGRAS